MAVHWWGVVVPLKVLDRAKTRLVAVDAHARAELALAFAEDAVAAALACPCVERVVVVTDDPRAAAALTSPCVVVEPDRPGAGLNPAIEHGALGLAGLGVAALAADLPALRPDELQAVLAGVVHRGFVADADRVGTTLLAAVAGVALAPAYGPGSRGRHLDGGAVELAAGAGLRRDVDTLADLEQALRLGVGARTAAALARLVAGPPARA